MATVTSIRPPITCHVLDTVTGKPASSIPVTLTLVSPQLANSSVSTTFASQTNSDGRVVAWTATTSPSSPSPAAADTTAASADVPPPNQTTSNALHETFSAARLRLVLLHKERLEEEEKAASSPSQPTTLRTDEKGGEASLDVDREVEEAVSQALGGTTSSFSSSAAASAATAASMIWSLKFQVGEYFRGEGFWTEVEVKFKTDVFEGSASGHGEESAAAARSHWHVPLLLSPWSYTTYRGS